MALIHPHRHVEIVYVTIGSIVYTADLRHRCVVAHAHWTFTLLRRSFCPHTSSVHGCREHEDRNDHVLGRWDRTLPCSFCSS